MWYTQDHFEGRLSVAQNDQEILCAQEVGERGVRLLESPKFTLIVDAFHFFVTHLHYSSTTNAVN